MESAGGLAGWHIAQDGTEPEWNMPPRAGRGDSCPAEAVVLNRIWSAIGFPSELVSLGRE